MAEGDDPQRPISVFCSYSHKDAELRNELADHLVPLERAGLIDVWHDREMLPGDSIDQEIANKLKSVDIVLVLVSPSFVRSTYCYDIELKKAIERHERKEAKVVPVILRPCQWLLTPLKELVAVPTDGKPVTEWSNRDSALNNVAAEVTRLAAAIRRERAASAEATLKPNPTPEVIAPAPVAATTVRKEEAPTKPEAEAVIQKPSGAGIVHVGVDPRNLPDLSVFKDVDVPWCPEMVVIPKGSFLMGSPEDEAQRRGDEGPQHRVTIGYRFALGKYAVTFDEYDHYCAATRREEPKDQGWGRGRRPVINVSWEDAVAYCAWLSEETGQRYRLPSEAEWEYACRAGTTTPFSFGNLITEEHANFDNKVASTTDVSTYTANSWNLCDMHGNVWEWVEDVWHGTYNGAPSDGSAWSKGEQALSPSQRVLRGGCWYDIPAHLRAAKRIRIEPDIGDTNLGFRVARAVD